MLGSSVEASERELVWLWTRRTSYDRKPSPAPECSYKSDCVKILWNNVRSLICILMSFRSFRMVIFLCSWSVHIGCANVDVIVRRTRSCTPLRCSKSNTRDSNIPMKKLQDRFLRYELCDLYRPRNWSYRIPEFRRVHWNDLLYV